MALALSASVNIGIVSHLINTLDFSTGNSNIDYKKQYQMTDTLATGKATLIWSDKRDIKVSAISETLDLTGGLKDAFQNAITFKRIKALIVMAYPTNLNDVVVGGATATALNSIFGTTDKVNIKPGGTVAFIAPDATGYVVTAGIPISAAIVGAGTVANPQYPAVTVATIAADLLKIANSCVIQDQAAVGNNPAISGTVSYDIIIIGA